MRICFVSLFHDTERRDLRAHLGDVPLYRHLPQEVAAMGHGVDFVHLFPVSGEVRKGGVAHRFVAEPAASRWFGRVAGRLLDRPAVLFEPALRTLRRVRAASPDVLHVHGTHLHLNLSLLRLLGGRQALPVVLHFHGGRPPEGAVARTVQRYHFGGVRRFLFTTRAHAAPFVEAGLIRDERSVVPFMELSSPFRLRPRAACRKETGMTGDPVFVWTGRLHPTKDPLTAFRGFERIARMRPEARLYVYHLTDELLPEVRAFLAARPELSARVHLRGAAPHAMMELVYNSADFFLQASLREYSGCAALEALSCGALPVVTDLPSFRAMTDGGRIGVLFPRRDDEALARRALAHADADAEARRTAVRAHFDRSLSYPALARQLDGLYREMHEEVRAGSRLFKPSRYRA